MDIGKSLRKAMLVSGIRNKDLAEMLDVHPPYISGILNNSRGISQATLCNISKILGYRVSEFIALGEDDNLKELRGIYIKKDRPDIEKSIKVYADKLNKEK